jgi:hypothetical protein
MFNTHTHKYTNMYMQYLMQSQIKIKDNSLEIEAKVFSMHIKKRMS